MMLQHTDSILTDMTGLSLSFSSQLEIEQPKLGLNTDGSCSVQRQTIIFQFLERRSLTFFFYLNVQQRSDFKFLWHKATVYVVL